MVGYKSSMVHMQYRFQEYIDAMKEAGLDEVMKVGEIGCSQVMSDTAEVLDGFTKEDKKMVAILFATNSLTVSRLNYFDQNRVKIREELAVIGFDGNAAFDFFYSPLAYIEQPIDKMGKASVRSLLDQITGTGSHVQKKLKHTLIERTSSG